MENISISPLQLKASRICLGTWAIGGWLWGGTKESDAIETILTALKKGINIIDTAPVYGFGIAEEIVGKAIKQHGQREKIIIATKTGLDWKGEKVFRNSSPARLKQELHDSLKRLQTDYIDIYQIHWPDNTVPMQETAATLLKFLEEGKIRAIGVSNFSITQMEEFKKVAPLHTNQPPYNLFERQIENEVLPFCEKQHIVVLAYGALCRGLLSGRISIETQFSGDDIRKNDPKFQMPSFTEYLDAVSELQKFAEHEFGKSVLALAVRWVLDKGHTVALWGARHPKQLDAVHEVMDWTIDADAMKRIDDILEKTIKHAKTPDFMAPPERH